MRGKTIFFICTILMLQVVGCGKQESLPAQESTDMSESRSEVVTTERVENIERTESSETLETIETSEEKKVFTYKEEFLKYVRPGDQSELSNYLELQGEVYMYYIYEFTTQESNHVAQEPFVVVFKGDQYVSTLFVEAEEQGYIIPSLDTLIVEEDVNFDEKKDILLHLGYFGNQSGAFYKCYIQNDGELQECESFAQIMNPAIMQNEDAIGSQWRDGAPTYGSACYRYENGEFVETDRLTETADLLEDQREKWSYTIETRKDGVMVIVEEFNNQELSDKEIEAKTKRFYEKNILEYKK